MTKMAGVCASQSFYKQTWLLSICSSKWLCGSVLVFTYAFKMKTVSNKRILECKSELGS